METFCDVCGVNQAIVYCKSHTARLCLICDENMHSANEVSGGHSRSWLTGKCCNLQLPAVAYCLFDNMHLCQNCVWQHKLCQLSPICPSSDGSLSVFRTDFSCVEFVDVESDPQIKTIEDALIVKEKAGSCVSQNNDVNRIVKDESRSVGKSNTNPIQYGGDHVALLPRKPSIVSNIERGCSSMKNSMSFNAYDEFHLDDLASYIGNTDNLLSPPIPETHRSDIYDDDEGLLDFQLTDSKPLETTVEATSSSGTQDFQYSNAAASTSMINPVNGYAVNPSCGQEETHFPIISQCQVQPSISLTQSNIPCESSSVSDLTDILVSHDGHMEPNQITMCPHDRDRAIRSRFGKTIRYESRKARADTRKRVKGRFVKNGEEYDYDPLTSEGFIE